ncbi:MAG: cation transporter [Burkholderiales bacterium]
MAMNNAMDIRYGLRLEATTIVWMVVEAVVSIVAGVVAGSLLLVTFGADSIIELVSAFVLFHRLWQQYRARHADEAVLEALERRAGRISGYLLYALCVYVVLQAVWGLTHRHQAETSFLGMAVAISAAVGMPILAKAKRRVADRINSPALRADAMETFTCGYLSWVLLAGLAANALLHWWWLDAVASLVIVPILLREAKEAISGECNCHDESKVGVAEKSSTDCDAPGKN